MEGSRTQGWAGLQDLSQAEAEVLGAKTGLAFQGFTGKGLGEHPHSQKPAEASLEQQKGLPGEATLQPHPPVGSWEQALMGEGCSLREAEAVST